MLPCWNVKTTAENGELREPSNSVESANESLVQIPAAPDVPLVSAHGDKSLFDRSSFSAEHIERLVSARFVYSSICFQCFAWRNSWTVYIQKERRQTPHQVNLKGMKVSLWGWLPNLKAWFPSTASVMDEKTVLQATHSFVKTVNKDICTSTF